MTTLADDDEASPAHLFRLGSTGVHAITTDATGGLLPARPGLQWTLVRSFELGVHHPLPIPLDPEPVLRAIRGEGYYLWDDRELREPVSTSQ